MRLTGKRQKVSGDMKRENAMITDYKRRRDECQKIGNRFYEAYFQTQIVELARQSPFSLNKKRDVEQHQRILYQILEEILGFWDENYFQGIYEEIILSGKQIYLTGREEECIRCGRFFNNSRIQEYVHGAYCLHVSIILGLQKRSTEDAERYAANILKLLETRYGKENWHYAKMKLHILGEYFYNFDREQFLYLFQKEYEYLQRHIADKDSFWCNLLCSYAYHLWESENQEYKLWLNRCVEEIERYREDKAYNFLKCNIGWLRAKILGNQNQNQAALEILEDTIEKYLDINYKEGQLFYAYVYLEAAWNCQVLEKYLSMYKFAQAGLELCEKNRMVGSELYYSLYNYVGIKMMQDGGLEEAAYLYSSSIKEIAEKYGTDNENYFLFMNNLKVICLRQGTSLDAYNIKENNWNNESQNKKFAATICNELYYGYQRGDSLDSIRRTYRRCMETVQGEEYAKERVKLKTAYIYIKISEHIFDGETVQLLKDLENSYKDDYCGEMGILYWHSVSMFHWEKNGDWQTAYEIYQKIMGGINEADYIKYSTMFINEIQLLIMHKEYEKAKQKCWRILNFIKEQIIKIGFGNIMQPLWQMRIVLSLCLHLMEISEHDVYLRKEDRKRLLEEIIYCKTIEREIKRLLSQYKEEEVREQQYEYCQANRKLAALELRMEKQKNADIHKDRKKYMLELERCSFKLSQKIPVEKLVQIFHFEDIRIPQNAVCAEYFAYWKFRWDAPMTALPEDENGNPYDYCVFVLKGNGTKTEIMDAAYSLMDETVQEEIEDLLDASAEESLVKEEETDGIVRHLYSLFAAPVLRHVQEMETIYLGADFLIQMLPMDLIYLGSGRKIFNLIMVDSVRYVAEDQRINIQNADALILGNPAFCISQDLEQKEPELPWGEYECMRIAELFQTKAYVGKRAKQSLLWEHYQKNVIHISTHGEFKFKEGSWNSSYIKLAGYGDWEVGRRNEEYGNGIVTGNDFLFMDLSKTDLVVLSACMSNFGMARGLESTHGMHWAIGTAGAGNSITTLWSVEDDASAVLMILFYRNLREMPVGRALHLAKQTLRNLTVEELQKDRELWTVVEGSERLQDIRPFSHWRDWAGFVCYCR